MSLLLCGLFPWRRYQRAKAGVCPMLNRPVWKVKCLRGCRRRGIGHVGFSSVSFSRCHMCLHVTHSYHVTPLSFSYERGGIGRISRLKQAGQYRSCGFCGVTRMTVTAYRNADVTGCSKQDSALWRFGRRPDVPTHAAEQTWVGRSLNYFAGPAFRAFARKFRGHAVRLTPKS